jgi:nitrous oxide reductase accessory protein NosL
MQRERRLSRRGVLGALGAGATVALAGCSGSANENDGPVPDPVDLSDGKFDYQGGMEIGRHGGPNGQVFYADNSPEPQSASGNASDARENLAWFHTLAHGLFPYHLDRRDQGWSAEVVYVTDYSLVDWQAEIEGMVMPAPTSSDTFAEAATLTFVAESNARGGMGPDLFPFSDADEATSFTDEYGGRTVGFDDIDRQLVEQVTSSGSGGM